MSLFEEYLLNNGGGGQYFTPEENKLFGERTYDSLKKLEKLGWKVEFEQPSFSGTLYRLWNERRSRVLYLSEKRLFQGKATIGKLVAAQNRLKLAKYREDEEEVKKYRDLIVALEKGLRESEEYGELFEQYAYIGGVKNMETAKPVMYKTLNDAADEYDLFGLRPGKTEIWYMKPEYFREFNMGWKFLVSHGNMETLKKQVPEDTHILLGKIKDYRPSKIFQMLQGEVWSPKGEARDLIQKKKLHHTSMSVGDVIVVGKRIFLVDMSGFKELSKETI